MRIGMILQAPYPPDVRVAREAKGLIAAGHEVALLCLHNSDRSVPLDENVVGVQVRRLIPPATTAIRLNNLVYMLSFVDFFWLRAILQTMARYQVGVLHIHDFPLMRTALLAGRLRNVPVVFDAHEMWPEEVQQWILPASWLQRHSIYSYNRTKRIERECFHASRSVLVPSEGRLWPLRDAGIPVEKHAVVTNWVDHEIYDPARFRKVPSRDEAEKQVFLYIGSLAPHRGIETLIQAAPLVRTACPNAFLHLRGALHSFDEPWLKQCIDEARASGCVKLLERGDFDKTPAYYAMCDVFAIPFPSTAITHHFDTINKVFEAMAMSRPLVVTDVTDFRPKIEEIGSGLVVPPENPEAMAEAIIRILKDREFARTLGENGYRAVRQRYNALEGNRALLGVYDEIRADIL